MGQWNSPERIGREGVMFCGVGVVVTLALAALRALFPWWPLHPLGYALCGSWTMILLWFPCLLTWVLKGALLRYGGGRPSAPLCPPFPGVILGVCPASDLFSSLASPSARTPRS